MRDAIGRHAFELTAAAIAIVVATHAAHLPAWLVIGAPAMILARVAMRRRRDGAVPMIVRVPAAILLLVAVAMQYGTVFGREPGSVLGCGLLALKLLETERARDARVALGFAAFVLISALLFVQDLAFTLAAALALVVVLAALIALQPAAADARRPLRTELRLGATLLVVGLPLAAAAFVLVPRLASPLWGTRDNSATGRTGLSDSMEPGAMTELLIDDSPAFRVRFDDASAPPPQARYFRSIVLRDFDGATWTRGQRGTFLRAEPASSETPPIGYSIVIEPTDRRWLPALDIPIEAPRGSHFTASRELVSDTPVSEPREYRVRSSLAYRLSDRLAPYERSRALALPEGFDPKTHALAESWRAQGLDDDAIVRAALERFRASFTYTLNPPLLGRDSIDDFLFSTQKGFCEHFASAFVVLMRAAGIPARVVTGFQGGTWNAAGGYLLVRNSDAHAWAEIWRPERGWVRVDPTAAVSPVRIELGAAAANDNPAWSQAAWLRAIRDRLDLVNGLWTRAIIRFDALRQKGMLTPFGVPEANPGDLLLALAAALAAILVLATVWAMRDAAAPRADPLDAAWQQLRRRLAHAGVEPRTSEGPLDLLSRTRAAIPASDAALSPLVQDYVALRYGSIEPEPERMRAFTRAVRNFRVVRPV
jgi:transglutaminase-like putative cysteine protease